MSYTMDFIGGNEINSDDKVYDYSLSSEQTFKVVCDPKSLLYIYGMQLDFSKDLIGGGFNFFNPNASQTCGCGSSFAVQKKYMTDDINPIESDFNAALSRYQDGQELLSLIHI